MLIGSEFRIRCATAENRQDDAAAIDRETVGWLIEGWRSQLSCMAVGVEVTTATRAGADGRP